MSIEVWLAYAAATAEVVGGLYLLFLGIKMLRAGIPPTEVLKPTVPASMWRLFGNTWVAGGSLLSIAGAWALLAKRVSS